MTFRKHTIGRMDNLYKNNVTFNKVDAIANHFMQLEVEADDPLMYPLQQGA